MKWHFVITYMWILRKWKPWTNITSLSWWVMFNSMNFNFSLKQGDSDIWNLYSRIYYCIIHEHNSSTKLCYKYLEKILDIISQDLNVSKSNQLFVDIFNFIFIELENILYILLIKWRVIFLKPWTSTDYFSNSTGSPLSLSRANFLLHVPESMIALALTRQVHDPLKDHFMYDSHGVLYTHEGFWHFHRPHQIKMIEINAQSRSLSVSN